MRWYLPASAISSMPSDALSGSRAAFLNRSSLSFSPETKDWKASSMAYRVSRRAGLRPRAVHTAPRSESLKPPMSAFTSSARYSMKSSGTGKGITHS